MSLAWIWRAFCVWPTAVHIWVAPQDTPLSMFCPLLAGLGVDRRLHVVPSQTSARVRTGPGLLGTEYPTAVQELAAVHDTLFKVLPEVPEGFGVGCMVQVDPFQNSARVSGLP